MKRVLSTVAAGIVAATSLTLATPSPAAAFGQETLGCRYAPGYVFTFDQYCTNQTAANTYTVGFLMENLSGSYTFSWSLSGGYQSIYAGCTSTSTSCAVTVNGRADSQVTATVTYYQNGQSATRTSIAVTNAVCGSELC
ncbi:hypothetical protein WEI85_32180 [Actinomycetes bacterium KLBMP 9797]